MQFLVFNFFANFVPSSNSELALKRPVGHKRNSTSTVYRWLDRVPWPSVQLIQQECEREMQLFGYVVFDNELDFMDKSYNFWDEDWNYKNLLKPFGLL